MTSLEIFFFEIDRLDHVNHQPTIGCYIKINQTKTVYLHQHITMTTFLRITVTNPRMVGNPKESSKKIECRTAAAARGARDLLRAGAAAAGVRRGDGTGNCSGARL